jgi:hypothetical protein
MGKNDEPKTHGTDGLVFCLWEKRVHSSPKSLEKKWHRLEGRLIQPSRAQFAYWYIAKE